MSCTRQALTDDSSPRQGFAYLEFADDASLQAAIQLSGTQLNDYALNVAKSRPPGGKGSRDGGRFGGRDGGIVAGRGRGDRFGGRHGGQQDGNRPGGGKGRGQGGGRGGPWQGAAPGEGPRRRVPDNAPHVEAPGAGPHQRLQPAGGASAVAFLPRAVAASKPPGKGPPPKSNADFRSMFLKKD
jgi:hypothetical protein